MKFVEFDSYKDFRVNARMILADHMQAPRPFPHAVMLPGGSTPFGIYADLAKSPPKVDRRLHVLLTDERHVPPSSPQSNFGRMQAMFDALGLEKSRILHPDGNLPLDESASRYNRMIAEFLERGGEITLALLGIGADGHTASLFNDADLKNQTNPYAVATLRDEPPNRISVTKNLLSQAKHVVFLCAGDEKKGIVEQIKSAPDSVVAMKAVADSESVEFWYSARKE